MKFVEGGKHQKIQKIHADLIPEKRFKFVFFDQKNNVHCVFGYRY